VTLHFLVDKEDNYRIKAR